MYGNAMYEVARQRVAEQQRDARTARQAREQRAALRASRRAKKEARVAITTPVIPDFAHEMFGTARDAVPAPRPSSQEAGRGRHAGTSH
jgi:hypothetical protein